MNTETEAMQNHNQTPLSEEVQQQDNIQTPLSEEVQHQDNNQHSSEDEQNENLPTDEQVIDCVEAIITTKTIITKKNERNKTVKPKVVSFGEGQELHIK